VNTVLQGGISTNWDTTTPQVQAPVSTGTNWGAVLSGAVSNTVPYIADLLAGRGAAAPVDTSSGYGVRPIDSTTQLQGGVSYQNNPVLPVQNNPVVQTIPQGSTVNTNYAPVQNNVDYTNIVNRAAVQTPNAPDFAQAPGGPTNPQFAVIQPGQNQGMPQASGPTAQPPGTQPIIGADGLIRIGRNTFSPNDVTAQGMAGGDYGYGGQPAYQQQPQYMPPMQQQNPYFPQGYGPNPYVQNQLQMMGMLPAHIDQSPAYQQALSAQQDVIRATSPYVNNQAAYPNAPAMYANQQGWRGRLNRFAGQLNPNAGAQMALRDKHAVDMYNAQVKEVGDDRRAAFGHRITAANNIMTQEGQNARQENKTLTELVSDFWKNNPNNPDTKLPLIKDMLSKFPVPGPARQQYIIDLNKDLGVNLYEYSDIVSPDEAVAYNNKLLQGRREKQVIDYYAGVNEDRAKAIALSNQQRQQSIAFHNEADKLRIQQMQTNNALAAGRLDIMNATKQSNIALNQARAERAQLELGIRKQYGKEMAEAQIAKLTVSRAATENKLIDSNVQGAKIIVDEFLKLQGQMAATMDPTIRAQLQSQMGVFGETEPIGQPINTGKIGADGKPIMISGGIPRQVHGAIRYLTEVAPAQKKELQDAYKKVEALNKAAKAGSVLPPIKANGELKATAGKLK
jgi:hypothetical protein